MGAKLVPYAAKHIKFAQNMRVLNKTIGEPKNVKIF